MEKRTYKVVDETGEIVETIIKKKPHKNKKVFLREFEGTKCVSLDLITMFDYEIVKTEEGYFEGIIYAYFGESKICVAVDDEGNWEDLDTRLSEAIETIVDVKDFDDYVDTLFVDEREIQ
jgi:hypothetical protein